jgi:hypothetical protein
MAYRIVGLIILAFGISGCAPTLTGANEAGGMVSHVTGLRQTEAFNVADAHCHQFGKVARISGTDALNSTMSFDCVAP